MDVSKPPEFIFVKMNFVCFGVFPVKGYKRPNLTVLETMTSDLHFTLQVGNQQEKRNIFKKKTTTTNIFNDKHLRKPYKKKNNIQYVS